MRAIGDRDSLPPAVKRSVEAVWRIESARIVATLTKMVGSIDLAEDLAQDALAEAVVQWPKNGVPRNAGAWLTAVAKNKAIDGWRRRERLDERYRAIAHDLADRPDEEWEPIPDDVLRLVFTACHPVLSREAQVALTLRVVGGLTTEEIARMFLVPVATMQQRIVRAKKTLEAARVPFETPDPSQWSERLSAVLSVIYLVFTEGYAATSGDRWVKAEVAYEALRLGRALQGMLPREPEVHGLVALMEFQAARFAARETATGDPILLADQDRGRWDHNQILRGRAALARADALGKGRAVYALQAAIAECHAIAPSVEETDWKRIVLLYEILGQVAPSLIVELNRAVAIFMATGPATALELVDRLAESQVLRGSHLLPSVRGELLSKLGRVEEARSEFATALHLTQNERERAVLHAKFASL